MDALLITRISTNFFDWSTCALHQLVRTWIGSSCSAEMLRVARPDGIVRVTMRRFNT